MEKKLSQGHLRQKKSLGLLPHAMTNAALSASPRRLWGVCLGKAAHALCAGEAQGHGHEAAPSLQRQIHEREGIGAEG